MAASKGAGAASSRAATPPPPSGRTKKAGSPGDAKDVDGSTEKKPTIAKPSFKVIYLTVFLDFFANGITLPVLQSHARGLGASGFHVGMVFTAYSFAQMPGSFIIGRLSDFIGRRPVIIMSLFMSSVTFALTLAAPDLRWLIVARAIAGFFSETSVCQAYIADKTTRENRPAALGHMGAFIGLGFVVGPMTGAFLGMFGGFDLAVKFTTVVTVLNFFYAQAKLDESLGFVTGEIATSEDGKTGIGWRELAKVLLRPVVSCVMVGQFALTFAFMGWDTTFALWAATRLGYAQKHTGCAFAWLAIGFFIASWKTRTFAKDPRNTSTGGLTGCCMMVFGLLAHRWIHSTLGMLLPLFTIGFGYALAEIVFQTLVSVHSPKGLQGSMLGALSAGQALARAVAPVAAGYLFDMGELRGGDLDFAYTAMAGAPALAALFTFAAYKAMPGDVLSQGEKKKEK